MTQRGFFKTGTTKVLFLLLALATGVASAGQKLSPAPKLTKADEKIRDLIHKKSPIDKKTFRNTTPNDTAAFWVKGLKRYQAMPEDWVTMDPPGPPTAFIVTPDNKICLSVSEALTSIQYAPKDDKDALKAAVMVAQIPAGGRIMIDGTEKVKGVPEDVLSKHNTAALVRKDSTGYEVTLFSYASTKTQNKFVRGYHALWKHVITIDGYNYKEKIEILWEKRD